MSPTSQSLSITKRMLIHLVAGIRRNLGVKRGNAFLNRIYPADLRDAAPIITTIRYHRRFSLHINTRSWLDWRLFADGYYEPNVVQLLQQYIRPGDHVVDVGANIGVHTLVMSDLVKHGRVYSFEPLPTVRKKLQENLQRNAVSNVIVHEEAVGRETGTMRLYFDPDSTNEGLASLYGETAEAASIEVDVRRLDDILADIIDVRLIKLDIQGGEFPAIVGAEQTIARCKPFVIFEYDDSWEAANYNFADVAGFFDGLGYRLFGVPDDGAVKPVAAASVDITEYLAAFDPSTDK